MVRRKMKKIKTQAKKKRKITIEHGTICIIHIGLSLLCHCSFSVWIGLRECLCVSVSVLFGEPHTIHNQQNLYFGAQHIIYIRYLIIAYCYSCLCRFFDHKIIHFLLVSFRCSPNYWFENTATFFAFAQNIKKRTPYFNLYI